MQCALNLTIAMRVQSFYPVRRVRASIAIGLMVRIGRWCFAAIMSFTGIPGWASEVRSYPISPHGWRIEQFGSDVAILRTPAPSGSAAATAGVLLSCSGHDRRVRLSFPAPIFAEASEGRAGFAMIRSLGGSEHQRGAVVRFTLSNASTILVSEAASSSHDIVSTVGQMLMARPQGLDVLISSGLGPVVLTRLMVYRLGLTFDAEDTVPIRLFLSACDRTSVGSAD